MTNNLHCASLLMYTTGFYDKKEVMEIMTESMKMREFNHPMSWGSLVSALMLVLPHTLSCPSWPMVVCCPTSKRKGQNSFWMKLLMKTWWDQTAFGPTLTSSFSILRQIKTLTFMSWSIRHFWKLSECNYDISLPNHFLHSNTIKA